ncbi:hypothetical protein VP1G_04164 [Cytospora mali]|uniref:Uncharacterized protein n=1 Tax=Cytospora mali TaxID=578113 RepID=A0A194UYR4_CYTMA|nr:hypothetical protein VP1G_04164 [Valsa mali var. pyri (nom. inval.)]
MSHPRPSTSGGLPPKGSSRANFDKRMSKDDMFFNSARKKHTVDKRMSRDDMHLRGRAMSQHRVPVRGSPLTPEHSPQYPIIHEVSIPVRMQTPESMTSGEVPIGMALGSPSLPTADASKRPAQLQSASSQAAVSSQLSAAPAAPTGSLQRKRTGRRTLFGLFGGGKKKEEAQVPVQVEAGKSTTTLGRLRAASTSTVNVPAKGTPTRSNTQTERKAPKHKPIIIRSQTLSYGADEPATQPESSRRPSLKSKASEPYMRKGNVYQRSQPNPAVPPIPSFLDVKIPDTTLERYSVMFSDVLNEGPKQEPAVSLLARRQATLERLKMLKTTTETEDMEKETSRQRRATSPQPAPTPKLALFPMPPAGRITPGMETPKSQPRLARSNTSPGRFPSPIQTTFDIRHGPPTARVPHAKNLTVPNPFENSPPQTTSRSGRKEQEPIYPTDTSFHFGPDETEPEPILESPTEIGSPAEFIITQPFKPTLHEPQWQMISPPSASTTSETPSIQSSTTSSGRRRSPSVASSTTTLTKPSTEIDDPDVAFQNAVEVSIARQISISRQQRQLLRPLQARRATGTGAGAIAGARANVGPLGVTVVKAPTPTRRLTDEEAIKETKMNTPRVVNPRENPVNPAHLMVNRKSSWAVVEGE